jgi:hypothetical protein
MQEIRTLPETEKVALFEALRREDREALLDRLEVDQNLLEARSISNDPNKELAPWEQLKSELHELRN